MTPFDRMHLVVLSHNRIDCIPRLFDNLLVPAAQKGVQITLVDNASLMDLRNYLAGYRTVENLEIILNERNEGVAKGRNLGFMRSNREFVVYIDDDSLIEMHDLAKVPALFDALHVAGILAFRVVHGETGDAQNEHGDSRVFVGNFHGAGHAIRRSLFDQIGYLDEECFFGAEEIEYSMRAQTVGMRTIYTPEITVRHFSLLRSGRENLQRRINWVKNYAMVLFRYLPTATAFLFCCRLFLSYMVYGLPQLGCNSFQLVPAMLIGARKGVCSKNRLNRKAIDFYRDPATRPDLGNVSVMSKLVRFLKRLSV